MPEVTPNPPLPVVLDTNALEAAGWGLANERMRVLEHESHTGAMTLYVPEVARRELVSHGTEAAGKMADRYRDTVHNLTQLGASDALDRDTALALDAYQAHLAVRLDEIGALVLPIPAVPHQDLVQRAIDGRKPFGDAGRGYKDALIWMTTLDLLGAVGAPVALVTNDADFRDGDDLADDLADDLEVAGHQRDAVRLYRTVGELIRVEVPAVRALIAKLSRRLADDEIFRDGLLAWMVALADEEGPAILEPALLENSSLRPFAVRFRPFKPTEAPMVDEAFESSNGRTPLVLTVFGEVETLISVDPRDERLALTVPLRSPQGSELVLRDNVVVGWKFEAEYGEATEEIEDLRLVGYEMVIASDLRALTAVGRSAHDVSLTRDEATTRPPPPPAEVAGR